MNDRIERFFPRSRAAAIWAIALVVSTALVARPASSAAKTDAVAGAAIVAPGAPLDVLVANDIEFRKGLGFRSDKDFVLSLYAHLDRTIGNRDSGALFTPAEAAEERFRREELQPDSETAEQVVDDIGMTPFLGAIFIDHEAGGVVTVTMTQGVARARAAMISRVRHPERLVVRQAPVTEEALNDALNNIDWTPIVGRTGPVHIAAVDVAHGRLLMAVDNPDKANAEDAGASVGVPVWFVTGSSATETADQNNDTNVPPYRGSHGILLYANTSHTGSGAACTLGFSARNRVGGDAAITAGHCAGSNLYIVFHNDSNPVYIGDGTNGYIANGGAVDYYAYSARSGKTTSPTVFWYWPSTKKVRATDAGHEKVGYNRRKNGRTTREGSGLLGYTNVDIDGSGSKYSGGWRAARYSTAGGDSGMNVWHHLDGYAYASGIGHGYGTIGGVTYGLYCHISYVLLSSGFTLKTTL
jgi:hypothetical protein